jgi:hypothetical protein
MFVIHTNWTSPTETYHTLKFWLHSDNSQEWVYMKDLQAHLLAPRWEVAKYLSEEEVNEVLHFPVSYYCNSHTNSCKNYKKSYLYNTNHCLIHTRVLGGHMCLMTLFSKNVIYGVLLFRTSSDLRQASITFVMFVSLFLHVEKLGSHWMDFN